MLKFVPRLSSAAPLAAVVAVAFASGGLSYAQGLSTGQITGEVDRCINGVETPAANMTVGIDGLSASLVQSDQNGQFFINLPPGQYTVVVHGDDGSSGSRQYVPVQVGQVLDIGNIDLGAPAGCDNDTAVLPPVVPAVAGATPTPVPAAATAVPAAPSPSPTPVPTTAPAPSGGSGGSGG